MDSALEILGFLIGVSAVVFVMISLLVMLPGRGSRGDQPSSGVVWLGGPGHGEHGVSTSDLVLADRRAHWAQTSESDWIREAETAEPGRGLGGASAGW